MWIREMLCGLGRGVILQHSQKKHSTGEEEVNA